MHFHRRMPSCQAMKIQLQSLSQLKPAAARLKSLPGLAVLINFLGNPFQKHPGNSCRKQPQNRQALNAKKTHRLRDSTAQRIHKRLQQNLPRTEKRRRPEKHPGNIHKKHRHNPSSRRMQNPLFIFPYPREAHSHNHIDSMNQSPHNKIPGRAMPESTQQENDQHILASLRKSSAVSSKWNIYIIRKPTRQADVPSFPEILYAYCTVRMPEIFHKPYPHHTCRTSCNICISGKIT